MEYLLKVSAVIIIFYGIYKLFLQRDTFFESNRWFLLMGLVSSLLIPLIVIPLYIEYMPVSFENILITEQHTTEIREKHFNIFDYLPFIYGLGVVFFAGRFFIQLVSLIKLFHKNQSLKKDGYMFIETQSNTSPFSFFKWIVYNPKVFTQTELEHIIEHEKTHAKQFHSVDILISQLFCVLLWFNPFIWFYNKYLKQNLEFIADKRTINQNLCKKSYQYTLLKTSMPSHQMALSNHFYNSLIKKRIVMLHKSKSKKINQLKYALVIPIVALFLMGFNTEEIYVEKQNLEKSSSLEPSKKIIPETFHTVITKDFTDEDFKRIVSEAKAQGTKLTFTNIKRNVNKEIIAINAAFANDNGSGTFNLNGKEPIKSFAYTQNEQGFGFQTVMQPNIVTDHLQVIGYGDKDSNISQIIVGAVSNVNGTSPLIVIDGKEISNKSLNDAISKDDIYSIDVIKGESAKNLYGQKGKDGVILITSKEKAKTIEGKTMNEVTVVGYGTMFDSTKATVTIGHKLDVGKDKHPLVIVDGKEMPQEDFEKLNPDKIDTVTVLKAETATKKYGDKGKNGVIEIITKN